MSVHQPHPPAPPENKIDLGLIGRPERLHHVRFASVGEIEDIFVSTKSYLENLALRTSQQDDILRTSALMLMDKENITRQMEIDAELEIKDQEECVEVQEETKNLPFMHKKRELELPFKMEMAIGKMSCYTPFRCSSD